MALGNYAAGTQVPIARSKAELERTLEAYGADQYMAGWDNKREIVAFRHTESQLMIRFEIPTTDEEREHRRQWRVLVYVVKAKLESIASGVSTFQEEFFAWVVQPNGRTFGEQYIPLLGNMESLPPLLPAPPARILLIESNAG